MGRVTRIPINKCNQRVKRWKNRACYSQYYHVQIYGPTFTPQIFKTNKLYESIKLCIDKRYDIDDDIEALLINNYKVLDGFIKSMQYKNYI